MINWWTSNGRIDPSHNALRLPRAEDGMAALRDLFPDAEADDLNFVLFSTSGVHGTYCTIEEMESGDEKPASITFLIVHPRIIGLRYGNCIPETPEDFSFLKALRQSSWRVVTQIGQP